MSKGLISYLFSISLVFCGVVAAQSKSENYIVDAAKRKIHLTNPDGSQTLYHMVEGMHYRVEDLNSGNGQPPRYRIIETRDLSQPQRYVVELTAAPLSDYYLSFQTSETSKKANRKRIDELQKHKATIDLQQKALINSLRSNLHVLNIHQSSRIVSNTVSITAEPSAVDAIGLLPNVKSVTPDNIVRAFLADSVPQTKADQLWSQLDDNGQALTGHGITIAVIDTGIDYTHPALGGCLGENCKVIGGVDIVNDDSDPMDDHFHGTHVAGILAGDSDEITGVAPNAKLLGVKVISAGNYGYVSDVIAGLEFAVDPDGDPATADGADIINMSLGSRYINDTLDAAVNAAVDLGALVVVAAGNDWDYFSIGSPGAAESALTVASVDSDNNRSYFSSRGPIDGRTYIKPEIAAPGQNVYSSVLNGQYETTFGTSMAAPHVAGIAALLKQAEPDISVSDLKSKLISGARVLETSDPGAYSQFLSPYEVGAGTVDALASYSNNIIALDPIINLGKVDSSVENWRTTTTLRFKNNGSEAEELTLNLIGTQSVVDVELSANKLMIPSQSVGQVELTFLTSADMLDYTNQGIGSRNFKIIALNDNNELHIPVLFDHYNELKILDDYTVTWVREYGRDDGGVISTDFLSSRDGVLKFPQKSVNLLLEHDLKYTSFGDFDDSLDETKVIGFTVLHELDLENTSQLSANINDFSHSVGLEEIIVNGESIDFADTETAWRGQSIFIDGEYVTGGAEYGFCFPECEFYTRPTKTWFSDTDANVEVNVTGHFVRHLDPHHTELFEFKYVNDNVNKTDNHIYTISSPPAQFSFEDTNDDLDIAWGTFAVDGFYGQGAPHSLDFYQFSTDDSEHYGAFAIHQNFFGGAFRRTEVFQSGNFNVSEDGILFKYQNSEGVAEEKEQFFSMPVKRINTATTLRYWSAHSFEDSSHPSWARLRRHGGIGKTFADHAFVRDIYQNNHFSEHGIFVEDCEGNLDLVEDSSRLNIRYSPVEWYWPTILCTTVTFHYGLDENNLAQARYDNLAGDLDALYPSISELSLVSGDSLTEIATNVDNVLSFTVSVAETREITHVGVAIRASNSPEEEAWEEIYSGIGVGLHSTTLPLPDSLQSYSLKIEAETSSGNQFTNIIPGAITLVNDITSPEIFAPEPITVVTNDPNGVSASSEIIQEFLISAYANDDIDSNVSITNNAPEAFSEGTTTVTFFVQDDAGNINSATSTVTVTYDNVAPVISVPNSLVLETDDPDGLGRSYPGIVEFLSAATALDNVDGEVSVTNDAPKMLPVGTSIINFSAEDSLGNKASKDSDITIYYVPMDTTAPVLTLPDNLTVITQEEAGVSSQLASINQFLSSAFAADETDGEVSVSNDAPAIFPPGVTGVTFSAQDSAGNLASETVDVTVIVDNEAPLITVPNPLIIDSEDPNGLSISHPDIAAFLEAATALDNIDGVVEVTNNAPNTIPVGTNFIKFFAEDNVGNQADKNGVIIINYVLVDTTAPTLSLPEPISVVTVSGAGVDKEQPDIAGFLVAAAATDDEDGEVSVSNDAPAIFPPGVTGVTFSAQDSAGNLASETVDVTVIVDNEAPLITVPNPLIIDSEDPNGLSISHPDIAAFLEAATALDNIDGVVEVTNNAPNTIPVGTNFIKFFAEDNVGNQADKNSAIIIRYIPADTTAPELAVPQDTTVTTTNRFGVPATQADIQAFLTQVSAIDETDGEVSVTHEAPRSFPVGDTVVTFSAMDEAGNIATGTATVSVQLQPVITAKRRFTPFDFDGDGRADVAVRRNSASTQFIRNTSDNAIQRISIGGDSSDIPISGDFDGDGIADVGIFRVLENLWIIKNSSGIDPINDSADGISNMTIVAGDNQIPVAADFDGDGLTDIAVRDVDNLRFIIRNSSGVDPFDNREGGLSYVSFGRQAQDIPVVADYDGDGRADIAVRRPSTQLFYVLNSSGIDELTGNADGITRRRFGKQSTDIPVTGDFDGDGKADLAVRRPATFFWYILNSSKTNYNSSRYDGIQRIRFGLNAKDIPITADYDGDGITDVAVRRNSEFFQFIKLSSDNDIGRINFGKNVDDFAVAAPVTFNMQMVD